MTFDKATYMAAMRKKLESYASVGDASWLLIEGITSFQTLEKEEMLLRIGDVARNFHFICKGALRAYVIDEKGDIYNKNIFLETDLAGSTVSCLKQTPSNFALEALEDSILLSFSYKKYRELIDKHDDLKNFYIAYLEQNWIVEKEQREVSLVMEDATERYQTFLKKHPDIDGRIALHHIAAHLGITPTQLSRIRKKIKKTP